MIESYWLFTAGAARGPTCANGVARIWIITIGYLVLNIIRNWVAKYATVQKNVRNVPVVAICVNVIFMKK